MNNLTTKALALNLLILSCGSMVMAELAPKPYETMTPKQLKAMILIMNEVNTAIQKNNVAFQAYLNSSNVYDNCPDTFSLNTVGAFLNALPPCYKALTAYDNADDAYKKACNHFGRSGPVKSKSPGFLKDFNLEKCGEPLKDQSAE